MRKSCFAQAAIAVCLVAAISLGGWWIWLNALHPEYPERPAFTWLTGLSMQSNGMRLDVKMISPQQDGTFQTTVTDLRTGKRWQRTDSGTKPVYLSNDRSRVLLAALAHGGGSLHLQYWSFRKDEYLPGDAFGCIPLSYFTDAGCLTFSPDGQYLAATARTRVFNTASRDKGYAVMLIGPGYMGTVMRNRRNLYFTFAGNRLIIDDHIHHYAVHLDTLNGQARAPQIDRY